MLEENRRHSGSRRARTDDTLAEYLHRPVIVTNSQLLTRLSSTSAVWMQYKSGRSAALSPGLESNRLAQPELPGLRLTSDCV